MKTRYVSMTSAVVCSVLLITACGEDKKDKAKVSAKMRSTGVSSLALDRSPLNPALFTSTIDPDFLGSSSVTLESFKMPVSSIQLAGINGGAGTSDITDIYRCAGATDDDCLVNMLESSDVDNLLQGAGESELSISEKTYNAFSVGHCHQNATTTKVVLKASVDLDGVTYYTNAASGLSTTAPSEEITVPLGGVSTSVCGNTSPLPGGLTVKEGTSVSLVVYGDPSAVVYATKDMKPSENCVGGPSEYLCIEIFGFIGTADTQAPTTERHRLSVEGSNDLLVTILSNSSGTPFGAYLNNVFTNEFKSRKVPGPIIMSVVRENADSSWFLGGMDQNGSEVTNFPSFQRTDHSGTIKGVSTDGTDLSYQSYQL